MSKLSPFDFIKSINDKNYLMVSPEIEKQYNPFIINRGLSQFIDCVPFVQKLNVYNKLSKKLQYDYLYYSVRKGRRMSKWAKEEKYNNIEFIIKHYKCSKEKAVDILDRLTEEQVLEIVKLYDVGGRV